MFRNLSAEMVREGLTQVILARTLGKSVSSVRNKCAGRTEFTRREMVTLRDTHFPELTLGYLFESSTDCTRKEV